MATNESHVNRFATEWLVARFIGSAEVSGDDSFATLAEQHFADDAAIRHLVRIVRAAEAPERFDLMPESMGLRAIIAGCAETGAENAPVVFDALLAATRKRLENGERLDIEPLRDVTTGLPNRMLLLDRLTSAIALAHRHDKLLAVCTIRFDLREVQPHVSRIANEITDRLRRTMREIDTVARIDTDEFAVVITDLAKRERVDIAVAKMTEILSEPFDIGDRAYPIPAHIGISLYPPHGHDASSLLETAREAAAATSRVAVYGEA